MKTWQAEIKDRGSGKRKQDSKKLYPRCQRKPDTSKKESNAANSMEDAGKRSCKLKKQLKEKNKGFTESKKKINTAKEILSDETKNIASVNQTLSEINASKRFIRDKCHNRERLKFRQQKRIKMQEQHFNTQEVIASTLLFNFYHYWYPARY